MRLLKDLNGHKASAVFSALEKAALDKHIWPVQPNDRDPQENVPKSTYNCYCYYMENIKEQLLKADDC